MADDYFQDLTGTPESAPQKTPPQPETAERSIRNVSVSINRPAGRPRMDNVQDMRPPTPPTQSSYAPSFSPERNPRRWGRVMLVVFGALVLIAIGAGAFFMMQDTSISVTPRAQTIVFNEGSIFTAVPTASDATADSLTYSVETSEAEDSEVVAANGTERVSEKASGKITVINNFSTTPVRLLKDTRFEAPDGKIFKVPEAISIPGKTASKPGELVITVYASEAGEGYNIGPVAKFTLPGLKSSPDMYSTVTARSEVAMTGGFVGERAAVAETTLQQARATIRARLESRVLEAVKARSTADTTAFPGLVRISYTSMPHTQEAGGSVRVHEKAAASFPVFNARVFASTVARVMSADAGDAAVELVPGENFVIKETDASKGRTLGIDPLEIALSGSSQLVWQVDSAALSQALAGKEKANFEGIIATFPGIETASTAAVPFWKGSFPEDPNSIKIDIEAPKAQ